MIKWEYEIRRLALQGGIGDALNEIGNEGWELIYIDVQGATVGKVGYIEVESYAACIFKRPKAVFGSWPICCGPLPETVKKHEHGD